MVHIAVSISVILAVFTCQSTALYVPTITCSAPVAPENGYFRPVKSHYPIGWKVVFLCNEGYELSGYTQSVCKLVFKYWKRVGVWNFPPPVCKRVQCPALIAPANGNVHVGGRYPGNRADYSCNDGFSLKGVGWRKCQDNGHWTGEAPICERVQCPALIAPDNGNVHVGGRYPGNRADYSCNDGFSLKGVGWRKCQDNGQWTREAPTCERVQCPALIAPDNGNVHVGGRYPGNRADYSCNDGFSLKGVGWRKCQDNGKWSGEAPICKRVDCGPPPKPKYGSVKFWTTTPGSKAFYDCSYGYQLSGHAVRKCRANGHWSGDTPSCDDRKESKSDSSSSDSSSSDSSSSDSSSSDSSSDSS